MAVHWVEGTVGVEADGPAVAADGEGGGAEEIFDAHAFVEAVVEDVEHVRAMLCLRGARGTRGLHRWHVVGLP